MRTPLIACGITWFSLLATAASAVPRISIASPPVGQPIHDVEPLITINYSHLSGPPLNLGSLKIMVNGVDWTNKFTVGPSSASYDVGPADRLVAGALIIAASIKDTAGTPANVQKTYEVFPTLQGVSPDEGVHGDSVLVSGLGLDPNPGANVLGFTSYDGSTVAAPFVSANPSAGEGTTLVPDGSITGPVQLLVNGKASPETLPFTVVQTFPFCGDAYEAHFMGDGSLMVLYKNYWASQANPNQSLADPRCPFIGSLGIHAAVLREFPNGTSTIVMDRVPGPQLFLEDIYGVTVDKHGTKFAVISWQTVEVGSAPRLWTVYYGNGVIPGPTPPGSVPNFTITKFYALLLGGINSTLPSDIDADGNLLFPARDFLAPEPHPLNFYRLPVAAGGTVIPEVVAHLPLPESWPDGGLATSFQVPCTGSAVVGLRQSGGGEGRVWLVDLQAGNLVRDETFNTGNSNLARAATTCDTDTVLGTTSIFNGGPPASQWIEIWRMRAQEPVETLAVLPPQNAGGTFALSSDGATHVVTYAQGGAIVRVPDMIDQCSFPGGGPPTAQSFPCAPLEILPTTTRWKPQRGDEPIEVHFYSPFELSSATLDIKGPNQEPMTLSPTPVLEATTEPPPNDVPFTYKLVWQGPWTTTVNGASVPLARGNYSATVTGVRLDGQGTVGSASYHKISLVEVMEVELEPIAGEVLDGNPAVGELPGQTPKQERPQEGKRIFAQSAAPGSPVLNRVQVIARIDPAIPADPQIPTNQISVRVHFRSFDVDDPAPYAPDKDNDQGSDVADNRGNPMNGTLDSPSYVDIAPGETDATTHFTVSSQPGDNYRVVASTSLPWLSLPTLKAKQPSTKGEMVASSDALAQVSDMLTVWRTLNIELESMEPPPTSPSAQQRNFIRGEVLKIRRNGPTGPPVYLDLKPDLSVPPLPVHDASGGNGRFEKGRIRIGSDTANFISNLDGNATTPGNVDYVWKNAGIQLQADLVAEGSPPIHPFVLEWDASTRQFLMDTTILPAYSGGVLSLGGVAWTVGSVNGATVTVESGVTMPFYLEDDDNTAHPFDPSRCLLQTSETDGQPPECPAPSFSGTDWWLYNPLAQAYIRPQWYPATGPAPSFKRNVGCPGVSCGICDSTEEVHRLDHDHSIPQTTPGFWAFYVQAAFQEDETRDGDPGPEWVNGGCHGVTLCPLGSAPCDRYGSLTWAEQSRDNMVYQNMLEYLPRCSARTLLHELGHQLDIDGDYIGSGIMAIGCVPNENFFAASELATIREKKGLAP